MRKKDERCNSFCEKALHPSMSGLAGDEIYKELGKRIKRLYPLTCVISDVLISHLIDHEINLFGSNMLRIKFNGKIVKIKKKGSLYTLSLYYVSLGYIDGFSVRSIEKASIAMAHFALKNNGNCGHCVTNIYPEFN